MVLALCVPGRECQRCGYAQISAAPPGLPWPGPGRRRSGQRPPARPPHGPVSISHGFRLLVGVRATFSTTSHGSGPENQGTVHGVNVGESGSACCYQTAGHSLSWRIHGATTGWQSTDHSTALRRVPVERRELHDNIAVHVEYWGACDCTCTGSMAFPGTKTKGGYRREYVLREKFAYRLPGPGAVTGDGGYGEPT